MGINVKLKKYIEKNIFPRYSKFYSHGMIHINNVLNNCLMLGNYYNLDENICYTMAAYHDLGLSIDRENHEREAGIIVREDKNLEKFFNSDEIEIIAQAVEDHRGSRKERPRSIYGEVLSDSDRDFDIYLLAKRQLSTSIKTFPKFNSFDEHFENCYQYITKRINNNGHFNLWTNNEILVRQREEFEKVFLDKSVTRKVYKDEYDRISSDGTIDKIINYYEDY